MPSKPADFNIERLRADVKSGRRPLRITSHAQIEAFKDGLLLADLRFVFAQGEVIEIYENESRGLLYAILNDIDMPAHIVVEDSRTEGVIVTAYVPDPRKWIGDRRRRRGKR